MSGIASADKSPVNGDRSETNGLVFRLEALDSGRAKKGYCNASCITPLVYNPIFGSKCKNEIFFNSSVFALV